jgi:hypothetical protein
MQNRVLLIGARERMLRRICIALQKEGFDAKKTIHFRSAYRHFNANHFDLVVFGKGIPNEDKRRLISRFRLQNPQIICLTGVVPIISLLVLQIKSSIRQKSSDQKILTDFIIDNAGNLKFQATIKDDCHMEIKLLSLRFFFRKKEKQLLSRQLEKGRYFFPSDISLSRYGNHFIVTQINNEEISVYKL